MMPSITTELEKSRQTLDTTIEHLQSYIYTLCIITSEAVQDGKKLFFLGEGTNGLLCKMFAQKLIEVYDLDRRALPAIALEYDFSRQLQALASSGDIVIGISTNGDDPKVFQGLKMAKAMGCKCIGLSGHDGGQMSKICDVNITIPSNSTARIQEMHMMIGHIMCQAIENSLVQS
jgi:D-sedoheptulose 7-phosphate isomerase